jgi:hypothetical protein
MFNFLKPKPAQQRLEIRDTLFGDIPLSRFLLVSPEVLSVEPWASFEHARLLIDAGDRQGAVEPLRRVLEMPNLESRIYLQAWRFLREMEVNPPPDQQKLLLGVVVEVGMEKGLDLVAGYSDHSARYYNFSGAGVVWEHPNDSLNGAIEELLRVGSTVLQSVGPWEGNRPSAPKAGNARVNLLTPSGLHFGQGPLDVLSKDRLGGSIIASAFRLMQALIQLTKQQPSPS